MSPSSDKVKILRRRNRLKIKAGGDEDGGAAGFIDPVAIAAAQDNIEARGADYEGEARAVLEKIESCWRALLQDEGAAAMIPRLCNYANNMKDMAETYGYGLMGYFGDSLRDFCERLDPADKAHRVIVQAHIDVMGIALKHGIRDTGDARARELKSVLGKAIARHG